MLDDFTHEWIATHLAAIINALRALHLERKINKRLELVRRFERESLALDSLPIF